jgi:hypothetical protein
MKLYKGKLQVDSDMNYYVKTETESVDVSTNDILLINKQNNTAIIGPMPENVSRDSLKDLLGDYYPVFVQYAFDGGEVEMCKIIV